MGLAAPQETGAFNKRYTRNVGSSVQISLALSFLMLDFEGGIALSLNLQVPSWVV